MKQLEQDDVNQSNMFVFLSDLWLDLPKVIKINHVFKLHVRM